MEDYKIGLGVDIDVGDIQTQLNDAQKILKPIEIKVDAETKELTSTIREALNSLSKGTKNTLTLDTSKLESSLNDVTSTIREIKTAIGTLDSGSNMKSLVSAINSIGTALDKTSDKFDGLLADLKSISGKDFNLNFGINLGSSNSVTRQGIYGNKVRSETLPQLKQQVNDLVKYYNATYKESLNDMEALQKMVSGTKLNNGDFFENFLFGKDSVASRMGSGSLSSQMQAYKSYIDMFKQAASLKGVDLSSVTSSFYKSADELIKDAQDIQTGAKEMEDSFDKLKQIFGGGSNLNIEGLSASLESIIKDLTAIREAIENLSKGISIEGLVSSFERLSDTIEKLVQNVTLAKNALGDGLDNTTNINTSTINNVKKASDDATAAVVQNEERKRQAIQETANTVDNISNKKLFDNNQSVGNFEKVDEDLKEISIEADNTSDAIQSMQNAMLSMKFDNTSIESVTKDLESMNIVIKEVSAKTKGEDFDITIKGINDVGEAVTVIKRLDEESGRFNTISQQISKPFDEGIEAAKRFKKEAETVKNIKIDIELGTYDNQISQMDDKFNRLSDASTKLRDSVTRVHKAYEQMEKALESTGDEVTDKERLIQAEKEYARALERTNNLIRMQARSDKFDADKLKLEDDIKLFQSEIDNWLVKNSAATKQFSGTMLDLKAKAEGVDRVTLNGLIRQFKLADKEAEKLGLKTQSTFDRLKTKFKEYMTYLSAAEILSYASQALRDMFEQVKLIDSAMTELKKVTNETDATYNKFLSNAADRAREIGTTIDGLVSSTADFARLGYGFEDAQGLAEVANIYAVVGDEIEGVEGATESLISTMAAFKDEMNGMSNTDFAMSIIDKFNEIGNNFAISSGGIGEALERSASSLMAANNTIDESIALITSANQVVQDPAAVGTAFKTISMRIKIHCPQ